MLFAQLFKHLPNSEEHLLCLKAHQNDLAYSFVYQFSWEKNHFQMTKLLKTKTDIYITRPDKYAGVVILNYSEYINKMLSILNDSSKFRKLGDVTCDDTIKTEVQLQKRLLKLHKRKFLTKEIYYNIHLIGSQHPWVYGLPEIHKEDVHFAYAVFSPVQFG